MSVVNVSQFHCGPSSRATSCSPAEGVESVRTGCRGAETGMGAEAPAQVEPAPVHPRHHGALRDAHRSGRLMTRQTLYRNVVHGQAEGLGQRRQCGDELRIRHVLQHELFGGTRLAGDRPSVDVSIVEITDQRLGGRRIVARYLLIQVLRMMDSSHALSR